MIFTEKKLLSDCGKCFVIDDGETNPNDRYVINIEESKYLILSIGGTVLKPVSKFTHPNIIVSRKMVYEFKHYRSGGGKFWTSQAGISHYLIIPRDKVYILAEKGCSWIHAEINGVRVNFNVSGGGGTGGWTDYLHAFTTISINHKLRDVKKIAEVAIRDEETIKAILARLEEVDKDPIHDRERELVRWEKIAAKTSSNVKKNKEKLLQRIQGKSLDVKIVLNDGYTENMGIGVAVTRNGKKERLSETSFQYDYSKGRLRNVIVDFGGGYPKRVKDSQIDWPKTVKENANLLKESEITIDNAVAV